MVLFVSQTKKFAFKKIYFMDKELPCIRNPEAATDLETYNFIKKRL